MADFLKLLQGGEHQHVDRKGPIDFDGDHRLELTKDIIAMANTRDGGSIIIGVSEDTATGTWRLDGMTPEQARTFDITKIHDFVKQRAAPPVQLLSETIEHEGKIFVLIQVSEFQEQPHVCTKEAKTSTDKTLFRAGDVLWRTEGAKSERVSDETGMRQLLGMAVQRRADLILGEISRIMQGGSKTAPIDETAWEICRTIVASSAPNVGQHQGDGMWRFILYPDVPLETGADSNVYDRLSHLLRDSQVSLRGWNFPHIESLNNRKDSSSSLSYIQTKTDWHDRVETTSLFQNGFFEHDRLLDEDLDDRSTWERRFRQVPTTYLDWLGALYIVGEFVTFANRLYQAFGVEGRINYEVRLSPTNDRSLLSRNPARDLSYERKCIEPEILVRGTIDLTILRANPADLSVTILKQMFVLFQWPDPNEVMLRDDLERLFTRRF